MKRGNGVDEKRFWTAKDVARYLNVHVETIYDFVGRVHRTDARKPRRPSLLYKDPPPYIRLGRNCIRFPIKEFLEWANDFRKGTS